MSEKLLHQILDKINDIEVKVQSIEAKVQSIDTKVQSIESIQQEHTQLLGALEHRSDVMGAKVIAMDETLQRTEGRINSLEKAITAIEEDAEFNHKETKEKLETLDSSIMYLASKLTIHDMQLFDMKRRAK